MRMCGVLCFYGSGSALSGFQIRDARAKDAYLFSKRFVLMFCRRTLPIPLLDCSQ